MRPFLTAFFALFLMTGLAHAGHVSVEDNTGMFSSGQISQIQRAGERYPFDLKVFTGSFSNRRALDISTSDCITAPTDVCVGLDPGHHAVNVHFGTGAGVRPPDYNLIAASGNNNFRQTDWSGGVINIADRAFESARSNQQRTVQVNVPSPPVVVTQTQVHNESHWFLWTVIVLGLAYFCYWVVKRVSRQEQIASSLREERDEYLDANVNRMTAPAPSYRSTSRSRSPGQSYAAPVAPAAAPTVINNNSGGNGGSGDLLTGVVIGEAISRPSSPSVVTREVVREAPAPSYSSPSYDSGGSSSGWGSSSSDDSSSSTSDSGGGSSGWGSSSSDSSSSDSSWSSSDSGGGFDSGGEGGDFGAGGSDSGW